MMFSPMDLTVVLTATICNEGKMLSFTWIHVILGTFKIRSGMLVNANSKYFEGNFSQMTVNL